MGTHPIFESDFDCLTAFQRMATERTFIAIKPDGVQRGLVGEIIKRFEQRGCKLVAMKLCRPGKEHLEKHYADLSSKGFFAGLIQYMNSGPICGDFSIEVGRNICHGSDAVESANAEIALWFKPEELISYEAAAAAWIYE